jgi:polar amino acid transport system substrate-binding protein
MMGTMRGGRSRLFSGPLRAALAIGAVVLVTCGCGVRAASPAAGTFTPRTRGVLTVAMSGFPTTGFWEGTPQHPTGGFEFELARALADRFDLKSVRVVVKHFHQIVAGDLGGADLALDLITPTTQREGDLEFSAPYLTDAPAILVRRGIAVPDLATAQDLKWGATRATTFIGDIETTIAPNAPVQVFDQEGQMMTALDQGRVGAVLLDLPLAVATARHSGGRLTVAAQLPLRETIAAALPKGSDNEAAVSSAIRAFVADGTVRRLLERWVGSSAANADTAIPLLHTTR